MGGSSQQRGGIIEGINVTPLVDIVLVLLIIFIVTAKFIVAPAVPLDLPQAAQSDAVQTILAVTVEPDGTLRVDGSPVSDDALAARAETALRDDPGVRAVIQADGDVRHRRVMTVLDALRSAGVDKVAFGVAAPGDHTATPGGE